MALELRPISFWDAQEFVREAKMFYESTNEAMQGGVIDG